MPQGFLFSKAGYEFLVRPVTPDDKPLIEAGFDRLSDRGRYLRFMSATPKLSRAKLAYLAEVDQRTHIAIGVLHGESPVAVGRLGLLPGSTEDADVAVTVVDEWQGRGIGSELIRMLGVAARHRGIERLHFDVLAENAPMLAVLARLDEYERRGDGPLLHIVVEAASIEDPDVPGSIGEMLDQASQPSMATRRSTKTA